MLIVIVMQTGSHGDELLRAVRNTHKCFANVDLCALRSTIIKLHENCHDVGQKTSLRYSTILMMLDIQTCTNCRACPAARALDNANSDRDSRCAAHVPSHNHNQHATLTHSFIYEYRVVLAVNVLKAYFNLPEQQHV